MGSGEASEDAATRDPKASGGGSKASFDAAVDAAFDAGFDFESAPPPNDIKAAPPSGQFEAASRPVDEPRRSPKARGLWQWLNPLSQTARDDLVDRWGHMTKEWDRVREGAIPKYLFLTKILLLHTRYVFGYLAAGFLVSAPLTLGSKLMVQLDEKTWEPQVFWHIYYSLLTGGICLIPFVLLLPLTQINWEEMRVPEFKIFELALTRWAAYVSFWYLVLCFNLRVISGIDLNEAWWFDIYTAWINFTLMVSAWARIKLQVLMFPDFYELKAREGLVLQRRFEDEITTTMPLVPQGNGPAKAPDEGAGPEDAKAKSPVGEPLAGEPLREAEDRPGQA